MQSLRSRKPSESQPKRQGSARLQKPGARDVNRRATRVDEKMKKRMSMRYADISAPTDVSVPDVPALPIGMRAGASFGGSGRGGQEDITLVEEPKEDSRMAELQFLDKDDFDSDACAYDLAWATCEEGGITEAADRSEAEDGELD